MAPVVALATDPEGASESGQPAAQFHDEPSATHTTEVERHGWTSEDDRNHWSSGPQSGYHGHVEVNHIHSGDCHHAVPPPPPPRWRPHGRYELQTVQRWVPGYYEKVWVERSCSHAPYHRCTRCRRGYYEQRWVPGYYETVQEWVWVPAARGPYRYAGR